MEKGKGDQFRGKKLSEIDMDNEIYCSSESENCEEPVMQKVLTRVTTDVEKSVMEDDLNSVTDSDSFEQVKLIATNQHIKDASFPKKKLKRAKIKKGNLFESDKQNNTDSPVVKKGKG